MLLLHTIVIRMASMFFVCMLTPEFCTYTNLCTSPGKLNYYTSYASRVINYLSLLV